MLKKAERLRRHEVKEIFSKGVEVITPFFIRRELSLEPDPTATSPRPARYAVVISKKMYGRIVDRNRLRREVFRYLREEIQKNPEYEKTVVVLPRARFFN